jgi:hypothetical protein
LIAFVSFFGIGELSRNALSAEKDFNPVACDLIGQQMKKFKFSQDDDASTLNDTEHHYREVAGN